MQKLPLFHDVEHLFSPRQMLYICHRLFGTHAFTTYCVSDQMPGSSNHPDSSQSQIYVFALRPENIGYETPQNTVKSLAVLPVCDPGVGMGFTSFLVWKSFRGNLSQLLKRQKNPGTCGHVRFLSLFTHLFFPYNLLIAQLALYKH